MLAFGASSPASCNDLRAMGPGLPIEPLVLPREQSATTLPELPSSQHIEVETKIELADVAAMRAFEVRIVEVGGSLVKEASYFDIYVDSDDLQLTRTDHFLRNRNGNWELKVPRRQNGKASSVYEEIEGEALIGAYFAKRYPHRNVQLPWLLEGSNSEESEAPSSPGSGGGMVAASGLLSPFVEFGTLRRRYRIEYGGSALSVDVDESSFGCCVAEIELMVS